MGAHFEIHGLPMGIYEASPANIANELKYQLMNGGTCAVYTEDEFGSTYATCGLMPGTVPEVTLVNRRTMEYALRVSLINLAASPTEMICHYFAYATVAYLMLAEAGILEFGTGSELSEATSWVKDSGSSSIYDLDDSRVEKDAEFFVIDPDSSLVSF